MPKNNKNNDANPHLLVRKALKRNKMEHQDLQTQPINTRDRSERANVIYEERRGNLRPIDKKSKRELHGEFGFKVPKVSST